MLRHRKEKSHPREVAELRVTKVEFHSAIVKCHRGEEGDASSNGTGVGREGGGKIVG